jgi:hypothetical protein
MTMVGIAGIALMMDLALGTLECCLTILKFVGEKIHYGLSSYIPTLI